MKEREKFGSRMGFILVSAGCAIGLGNVWKFPYMAGEYGGAAFILMYLLFLLVLGLPILVCEFSVGRASRKSTARAFHELEPKGSNFHKFSYMSMVSNYVLMMFYTMVAGWMAYYCYRMAKGEFSGVTTEAVQQGYDKMLASPGIMTGWMIAVVILGFLICSLGVQRGLEKITKVMMTCLLVLIVVLAVRSLTLPGAEEGVRFYLVPNMDSIREVGLGNMIFGAMSQAFFTLSLGIGALAIFGSYIGKERKLTGEAVNILVLDTTVALIAGLIIFPACFAFGINPGEGPGLVFVTLPNVFNEMPGGRLWGALFFLFMTFAALSTIIAVFQNLISFAQDLWNWSLKKAVLVNGIAVFVLSLPCIFGMTIWSDFTILGKQIMDFEDFLVSNNMLTLGSLVYLLFCVSRYGWGWDKFLKEANTGEGLSFPKKLRVYLTFVLPLVVFYIFIQGYWSLFQNL